MNLSKLFDAQKKLREHINYNGEDRFEKLILALLVEIGECANCWRGFKYWSKDQEPRTKTFKSKQAPGGEFYRGIYEANPLLEEYVDGLHFVLELGIEMKFIVQFDCGQYVSSDITKQFILVQQDVSTLYKSVNEDWDEEDRCNAYVEVIQGYVGLGKMLGFTEKEIEQAYYDKNQINHERQNNGY